MNNKELWAVLKVKDVVEKTEIEKVLKCYDFKKWEVEELLSIKCEDEISLNAFRWNYARETLAITDESMTEVGFMVRDLIEDIKMGYYILSNQEFFEYQIEVLSDIQLSNKNRFEDKVKEMNFDFELFRDFNTSEISLIHIYYNEDVDLSYDDKKNEITTLLDYLNLKDGQTIEIK